MSIQSRTNQQSLATAISLLDRAAEENRQALLDSAGKIFLGPKNSLFFQIFARKNLSVASVIQQKMIDQLVSATGATRERCLQVVTNKVELRHIQKAIDHGNLREVGAKVMREATTELYRPDSDFLDRLKTLLPTKLLTIFNKTGVLKQSQSFSTASRDTILKGFTSLEADLNDEKQMGADGIHLQTRKDFERADFSFHSPSSADEFCCGKGKPADRASGIEKNFRKLAKGDQEVENKNVLKVLTTVVGQRALAAQFTELRATLWDNHSVFRNASSDSRPAESVKYGFREIPGKSPGTGSIIVTLDYYRGGTELSNGDKSIPIKTSLGPEAPVGPDNYAIKCSVAIKLLRSDMEQGVINPKFVGSPSVNIQFTPDL
ncbi:hypothetical protein MCEMAEM21_01740 [Oxalobacteraceae bacterium]